MTDHSRTVLVTGAAGGIGFATLALFASKGWRVIGVDRLPFGEGFPADGLFIQADISRADEIAVIFEKARQFTDSLDALVNNAAMQIAKPLLETSAEEWDAVMASNLRSVFLGAKLAHPLLKARGGGAVVNVSSVHAIQTSANIAAYAASKGGMLALTRAMAIEFAADNIRVNAILPGLVAGDRQRRVLEAKAQQRGLSFAEMEKTAFSYTSIKDYVTPQQIADQIVFMCSPRGRTISGQAISICGDTQMLG